MARAFFESNASSAHQGPAFAHQFNPALLAQASLRGAADQHALGDAWAQPSPSAQLAMGPAPMGPAMGGNQEWAKQFDVHLNEGRMANGPSFPQSSSAIPTMAPSPYLMNRVSPTQYPIFPITNLNLKRGIWGHVYAFFLCSAADDIPTNAASVARKVRRRLGSGI